VRLTDTADVLTVEQAAEVLHVSRGTAYEAVRAGQIPSVRVGRCIRIPRHALEQMLSPRGMTPTNGDGPAAGEADAQTTETKGNDGERTSSTYGTGSHR
jgi:excisionase family DNA binding protein